MASRETSHETMRHHSRSPELSDIHGSKKLPCHCMSACFYMQQQGKKSLVNKFAELGLSVSYDRLLSFNAEIAYFYCGACFIIFDKFDLQMTSRCCSTLVKNRQTAVTTRQIKMSIGRIKR